MMVIKVVALIFSDFFLFVIPDDPSIRSSEENERESQRDVAFNELLQQVADVDQANHSAAPLTGPLVKRIGSMRIAQSPIESSGRRIVRPFNASIPFKVSDNSSYDTSVDMLEKSSK
jgi:hypothetical protein